MAEKYLLNIQTGKIHSAVSPCGRAKKMAIANQKFFETYEEAKNYFEGKAKKGIPCVLCFPERQ